MEEYINCVLMSTNSSAKSLRVKGYPRVIKDFDKVFSYSQTYIAKRTGNKLRIYEEVVKIKGTSRTTIKE